MNALAVSSILAEGTIISTRLGANNVWYECIVYKSENDLVYIPLIDNFLQNSIMLGINIALKFGNEYFEYLFEGVVSDIRIDFPGYVVVQVNRADEKINSRVFPRYDSYLALKVKSMWDDTSYFAVTNNISLIGIAFAARHQFDYGEEAEVSIYLPSGKPVYVKGKIIRKSLRSHFIEYGMLFTEMLEENNNLLSSFLSGLEEDRANVQSYFYNNIKNLL